MRHRTQVRQKEVTPNIKAKTLEQQPSIKEWKINNLQVQSTGQMPYMVLRSFVIPPV